MPRAKRPAVSFADKSTSPARNIVHLATPTLFEGFSRVVTQYVDTAMVGILGSTATAAVGIDASVLFLLWGIVQSIATAFSVMYASAIGAQDDARRGSVARHALAVALLAGLVLALAMLAVARAIPGWLGAAPDVVPQASAYLRIVGAAVLFQSLSLAASGLLRSAGDARTPFVVNLVANLANIIGNLLLIPEPFALSLAGAQLTVPCLGLGVAGAATSTAASQALAAALMLGVLLRKNPAARPPLLMRPDAAILHEALVLGTPIAFERVVLAAGQIALTAMVTSLGTIAIAAHYIANSISTLSYETASGFSVACMTLVAQCRGARRPDLAQRYMRLGLAIGVGITAALSAVVFAMAGGFANLFTSDAAVAAEAVAVVRLDAVFEPVLSVAVVLCGVFRGYGDTRFPFVVSVVGFLVTRLVSGYILGHVLGLGLLGIWIGIELDAVTRMAMCLAHMRAIGRREAQNAS